MKCAWQAYLNLLPPKFRASVDAIGSKTLQELRLRSGMKPQLITGEGITVLPVTVTNEDLQYVISIASRYSPWASASMGNGYLTAEGGHRIGVCGAAVIQDGTMTGYRTISSVCIRVARDFSGIAAGAAGFSGSVLIIGKPGSGKTTLLRDLVRMRSAQCRGSIVVVDERGEIFPAYAGQQCFDTGSSTDVLTGCSKKHGIELALRTMSPACIAVDEISAEEDCQAIVKAGWCGVPIIATAHAGNMDDLYARPVYQPIVDKGMFQTVITMHQDKSWRAEEVTVCT